MNFSTSIKTVYNKYFVFHGRAIRSEFWWFTLYQVAVGLGLEFLLGETAGNIWSLAHLIPSISVACRRLHDIDRSGWWQLLPLLSLPFVFLGFGSTTFLWIGGVVGIVLYIVLIVWYATPGTPGANRYGPDPFDDTDAEIFA